MSLLTFWSLTIRSDNFKSYFVQFCILFSNLKYKNKLLNERLGLQLETATFSSQKNIIMGRKISCNPHAVIFHLSDLPFKINPYLNTIASIVHCAKPSFIPLSEMFKQQIQI